jgi:hypothetical protein
LTDDTDDLDDLAGTLPPELERLLAGTLALMTTWYRCPQPAVCRKLLDNLLQIGRHEAVTDPLRRVCANTAARWAGYLEEIELAIEDGVDVDDDDGPRAPGGDAGRGSATLH